MKNKVVWTFVVLAWLALFATIPATIHDWSKTGPNVFWAYAVGVTFVGVITYVALAVYRKPCKVR
jgi:hypothetical protein